MQGNLHHKQFWKDLDSHSAFRPGERVFREMSRHIILMKRLLAVSPIWYFGGLDAATGCFI
jgi:hypothetical protein